MFHALYMFMVLPQCKEVGKIFNFKPQFGKSVTGKKFHGLPLKKSVKWHKVW